MATVTKTRLGPADHGRPLTFEEYMAADYESGPQYELIDGRLYVAPQASGPEGASEHWLFTRLLFYSRERPEIINFVYNKTRVFIPGRPGTTTPEPDVAAYQGFPLHLPFSQLRWEDLSPLLVVEVVSAADPHKDLVRNVQLYSLVPSIKEYWILDTRESADRPTMPVYRKSGRKWRAPLELAPGDTYSTKLLPGFELKVDPRS